MVDSTDVTTDTSVDAPADTIKVDYYVAQDGKQGRAPGVYLDALERTAAERRRAVVEGREKPEFDLATVASTAGTPLVVKEELADNSLEGNVSPLEDAHADPLFSADVPVDVVSPSDAAGESAGQPTTEV